MSQNVTFLFLSLTTTVHKLAKGELSDDDLLRGLFYFGCLRKYIVDDELGSLAATRWWTTSEDGARRLHARLRTTVLHAESKGRAIWRPTHFYEQKLKDKTVVQIKTTDLGSDKAVDELLTRNGWPSVRALMETRRQRGPSSEPWSKSPRLKAFSPYEVFDAVQEHYAQILKRNESPPLQVIW